MNPKKLLTATVVIMLISLIFPSINTVGATETEDSYLIEDVPYVSQFPGHCFWACLEMIYRFYGFTDLNQTELSVLQGQSYNLVYQPSTECIGHSPLNKPLYKYRVLYTAFSNQGNEDIEFLADLLGFEVKNYNARNDGLTPIRSWNDYWTKVKQEISNNTPLITVVDMYVWPPQVELLNISLLTSIFIRGGHSVLIVGYNETNNTVCVHDPNPGDAGHSEKVTYYWVSLDVFKRAVRRAYWSVTAASNYDLYVPKKVSEPRSIDDIFRLCHERNIEKMKGNKSAYDADFIAPNFDTFGIDAWKQLKDDYEHDFLSLLPFYRISNKLFGIPLGRAIFSFNNEVTVAKEVVAYLQKAANILENESLQNICMYEFDLFYNKSIKLEELTNLTRTLDEKIYERFLLKAYQESSLVIQDICSKIDEIISIEEQIIAGPSD